MHCRCSLEPKFESCPNFVTRKSVKLFRLSQVCTYNLSFGDTISPQIEISKCMKAGKDFSLLAVDKMIKIKVLATENERQLELEVQLIFFLVIRLDEIYGG